MNFSTRICRSLNILEPRLVSSDNSSNITSRGTLIFLPRFKPELSRPPPVSSMISLLDFLLLFGAGVPESGMVEVDLTSRSDG